MSTANSLKNQTSAGNQLVLPIGVELGQYRIIRALGQGGFGITYLAEVVSTGEQVVIKENLPTFCAMRARSGLDVLPTNPDDELQEYAEYLRRFVDEARLLAQLSHPNIVKVLGAFEALGTAYYVMPWVGGKELQKSAPAPGIITESWLLPILRTLLSTLEYLHGNNIYHRDVKPANILLTEEGTPVLIDFGTARAIISDRSATHVGSPGYSPIEQLRSRGKRGPWTDVYSLGATCYRLITGERPPEALDRMEEDEDPLRPLAPRAELRGRFCPAFLATIDKALAQRGKDRWQTATEWLAALPKPAPQSVADIPTTPISVAPESAPRPRRNMALIVLILVLVLGIPGGYMLYQYAQEMGAQRLLAQLEAERQEKEEAERQATKETERRAREEAERKAKEEAERKAKKEAERKAKEEAERKAKKEAERKKKEAERKAKEEARRKKEVQRELNSKLIRAVWYGKPALLSQNIAAGAEEALLSQLLTAGADVNAEDDEGGTPLLWAAWDGHAEWVSSLLGASGIDVNKAKNDGATPLYKAAGEGHVECVKLLLYFPGIDVNKAKNDGATPLYKAAGEGHAECVKLLLSFPGIDVNKANGNGWTPLHWAAYNGHTECVSLLLSSPDIDVNKEDVWSSSALCNAAMAGHAECVQLLLSAPGIDVNKADMNGYSPLHLAADNGHAECVRLLLSAPGIDVNKVDGSYKTPLRAAELKGHTECARLLREAVAPAAIDKATAQKKLQEKGIKQDQYNKALLRAIWYGQSDTLRLLLAAGADVNKADKEYGHTPLHSAAQEGYRECMKLLLAAPGIDVNKADKVGRTPLYRAAYDGHSECMKLLLAAPGIDVNKATEYGWIPLHRAADEGHSECVKLLLAVPGIDVNKADKNGTTPLKLATEKGHTECARLIRAAGGR